MNIFIKKKLYILRKKKKINREGIFEGFINFLSTLYFENFNNHSLFKSANQITIVGIIFGISSFVIFILFDNFLSKVLGSIFLFFFILSDFLDGDYARLNNDISKLGERLEILGYGLISTLLISYNIYVVLLQTNYEIVFILLNISFFLTFLIKEEKNKKKSNKKTNINVLNIKKVFNYFLRPTFVNVISFFIILNFFNYNIYFSIYLGATSIMIFLKNLIRSF